MPQIAFFHMNGCGHCDAMMPEWKIYVRKNPRAIHCEASAIPALLKSEIRSFPTIVVLDGMKILAKHSGPRTADSFAAFASKNGVV